MRSLRLLLLLVAVAGLSLLAVALVLRLPGAAALTGNADVLYLPALFDDLHRGLDALHGWHLTPGPYVFPDMLVYGLADLATGDFRQALPLAAALQLGLLLLLGGAVHRAAGGRSAAMAMAAFAVVLAGIFAFGWGLAGAYVLNWLIYPFVVTFHFGAILIAAAVLLLVLRQLDSPGPWKLAGLAGLILAGVLSDSFVLPYAAAPALGLALLCAAAPRIRGLALATAAVVGTAALAAFLLQGWINPLSGVYRDQLDLGIGYGLFRLGGVLWRTDAAELAVNLGLIAFALLPVFRTLAVLRGLAAGEREIAPADRIAVFAAASSLATLLAVVLFGIFRDELLPALLPALAVPDRALARPSRRRPAAGAGLAGGGDAGRAAGGRRRALGPAGPAGGADRAAADAGLLPGSGRRPCRLLVGQAAGAAFRPAGPDRPGGAQRRPLSLDRQPGLGPAGPGRRRPALRLHPDGRAEPPAPWSPATACRTGSSAAPASRCGATTTPTGCAAPWPPRRRSRCRISTRSPATKLSAILAVLLGGEDR